MNAIVIPNKTYMSEVDLILYVLLNLPEGYEGSMAQLEKIYRAKPRHYQLKSLRESWTQDLNIYQSTVMYV